MVVDAVRTYLDAANGLTELSRKDAVAAAKALLRANGQAVNAAPAQSSVTGEEEARPATVGQSIQNLAGELIETSQSNRAAIADLVRTEVTRQLESVDAVPRAEYERVVRRVAELERRLAARHAVERALATEAGIGAAPEPSTHTGQAPEEPQETAARPDEEAEEPQKARREPDEQGEQETGPTEEGATGEVEEKASDAKKKGKGDGTADGPVKTTTGKTTTTKTKSRSAGGGKRTAKTKGSTGPTKK